MNNDCCRLFQTSHSTEKNINNDSGQWTTEVGRFVAMTFLTSATLHLSADMRV